MRTFLCDLRLTVHLGHQGKPCPYSGQVLDRFTVVHTNGIHTVKIRLCSCHSYCSHAKFQLLRCSWLPATTEDPQTAFMFDVLDSYLLLSLQGKVSREDYYVSISRHTNNTGLDPPKVINLITSKISYVADFTKVRYTEFLRVVQIWEYLMLLKRSGRGHEREGVEGTGPGQCAVECPACPYPGRNVPLDWDNEPKNIKYTISVYQLQTLTSVRWKYWLILTVDANFWMKNKERNTKNMPTLGDGWAHFVPETLYMEHVRKWGFEQQVRFPPFDYFGLIIDVPIA